MRRREVLARKKEHLLVEPADYRDLGLLRLVLGSCRFFLVLITIFKLSILVARHRLTSSSRYICAACRQRFFR